MKSDAAAAGTSWRCSGGGCCCRRGRCGSETGLGAGQDQLGGHAAQVLPVAGMPQAEVAHLVEASREHVLEIAAKELVAGQLHRAPGAGVGAAVPEAHGVLVEADEAGAGDGHALQVAPEVLENPLGTAGSRLAVDDPVLAADGRWNGDLRQRRLELREEHAAEES